MSNGGSYDPSSIEPEIYKFWEDGGYFHAEPDPDRKPYVIDIPLPNVTGSLHVGHALNNTIQDVLIRHKRMCGYNAMWMPGTDHAGIATQAVVEKRLKEDENLTRHELGRDGLVKRIWEWKEKFGGRILEQLRRIGCSCDWERTRFTLDEVCAKAVYEAFFRFFKDRLIYRGLRLVNWDAHLQTAVADDEIIYETIQGHLWQYRYPIEGAEGPRGQGGEGKDYLSISTTRPETMLGDTAIAVHPDDERYKHLIGKNCILPLMDRPIPIIADGMLVKREFGTGCVKVTPAHDPNDYACGQRNNLKQINILTTDGRINENGGKYAGLDRYEARERVVADLEALGLMEKVEPYQHEVGHSDRSKTPIEPMLSKQWFMKMSALAETAMEAVRDGRVKFFPERYAKTYLDWLGEKRDWCISRQLWWGHRIPVWSRDVYIEDLFDPVSRGQLPMLLTQATNFAVVSVQEIGGTRVWHNLGADQGTCPQWTALRNEVGSLEGPVRVLICVRPTVAPSQEDIQWQVQRLGQELAKQITVRPIAQAVRSFIMDVEQAGFEQDPDVLDTWFSSALWPFSTLGWPDNYGRGGSDDQSRDRKGAVSGEKPLADARGSERADAGLTDLDYFYPTSTLVTAREIITLWVARMVMTSLYFNDVVPFDHVHIHPNIQDGQGRRMSKSAGNGVDPLDIIELYGTDAMRFTLAQMATETQDMRLPVKPIKLPDGRQVNSSDRFELGRNFCNKLWQAATGFVMSNLEGHQPKPLKTEQLAIEDHWILSRLSACIEEVDRRFERYQINEAANTLYAFFWSEYCDWYVELVKPRLFSRNDAGEMVRYDNESSRAARQVLAWVLDQSLRLLHPIMPFITEELWHRLNAAAPRRGIGQLYTVTSRGLQPARPTERGSASDTEINPALIVASWPDASAWKREADVERDMWALRDVIRALREIRNHVNGIRSAARQSAIKTLPRAVVKAEADLTESLRKREAMIHRLGQCETLEIGPDLTRPPESVSKVLSGIEVYVPLSGLADLEIERKRLRKELGEIGGHIRHLQGKLTNEGFISKAPPEVVERERARLAELREKLAVVERNMTEGGG